MINYNEEDKYTEKTAFLKYNGRQIQWEYRGNPVLLARLRKEIINGNVLNVEVGGEKKELPSILEKIADKKINELRSEISLAQRIFSSNIERGCF